MDKKITIIMFGPQGSGKGTQAEILARCLQIPVFSMGYGAKKIANENTKIGRLAKNYYKKGILYPEAITEEIIKNSLRKIELTKGIIFDGFPRTKNQIAFLEKILQKYQLPNPLAIYLKISKRTSIKRLSRRKICAICNKSYFLQNENYQKGTCTSCGGKLVTRPDDLPEAIKKRLSIYYRETDPILDYYRAKSCLIEIDGEPLIDKVSIAIIDALKRVGIKS